jgi:YgiT-type zinc finger domain-containing protein
VTECSIKGCPGSYEPSMIIHTVKSGKDVIVFENVPAEVCNVCSDTLLAPETVRHLEALIRNRSKPDKFAPLYEYV